MSTTKVRDAAQQERARRELARRQLIAFAWYTWHGYRAAPVHELLATYLEQVERYIATGGAEGIGRLMVFVPPRHGKSELVSVRFPAWFLGRNPDKRVVLASCTADLAVRFSRQVRDTVADLPFSALWGVQARREPPVTLSETARSAEDWDLAQHRGGLKAVGVGGSIVGRGADLAIIDDPFKNREEAESRRVRDLVDSWYRSVFYSRLEPGGAIVLMHQRWHQDDLAGRLLKRMATDLEADQWTVLCLPAVAEDWADGVEAERARQALLDGWYLSADPLGRAPGAALWPGKYPLGALNQIRTNAGRYEWEAMYQQRPQTLEGALIKAYEIRRVLPAQVPADLREVRYWDLAVSGKETADYLAGARVGVTADGRWYILHVDRRRGPWSEARGKLIEVMLRDPAAVRQGVEVVGQQGGYFQELQREPRLQGRTLVAVNPREVGDKEVRAGVWASRIQDGLVYLVDDGTWDVDSFLAECAMFPKGSHDDQVDAVSGAVQMLASGSGWVEWARLRTKSLSGANLQGDADEHPRAIA